MDSKEKRIHELEKEIAKLEGILAGKEELIDYLKALSDKAVSPLIPISTSPNVWDNIDTTPGGITSVPAVRWQTYSDGTSGKKLQARNTSASQAYFTDVTLAKSEIK